MKKAMSYVIGQNLGGLWFMLVRNSKNVFAIQYVYDFYSVCFAS